MAKIYSIGTVGIALIQPLNQSINLSINPLVIVQLEKGWIFGEGNITLYTSDANLQLGFLICLYHVDMGPHSITCGNQHWNTQTDIS